MTTPTIASGTGPMTDRNESLIALAARCEKATGPDRELDRAILHEVYSPAATGAPHFTRSLDAAMTLMPEGCIVMITNTGVEGREADLMRCSAIVGPPDDTATDYTSAETMPLALCAAALRARASQ